MEHYFKGFNIEEKMIKVNTNSLYMTDGIMLWWRRRCTEIEKGLCTIDVWEALKKEIKSQFYLENIEFLTRKSLLQLKYMGFIKDYEKESHGAWSTSLKPIPLLHGRHL